METEERLTEVRQCMKKMLFYPSRRAGWVNLLAAFIFLLGEWVRWWRHPHYSSLQFIQGFVFGMFLLTGFMQLQTHLFSQRLEAILNDTGTAKPLTWWTTPKAAILLIIGSCLLLGLLDLFMR